MVQLKQINHKMTYIYVMPLHEDQNGYSILQNGGLPPSQPPHEEQPPAEEPKGVCGRLRGCCKKKPKPETHKDSENKRTLCCFPKKPKTEKHQEKDSEKKGNLCCFSKKHKKESEEAPDKNSSNTNLLESGEEQKKKWWQKINCCRRKKVGDSTPGCFPIKNKDKKGSRPERMDSITSEPVKKSPKDRCKDFLRTIFCINLCSRKRRKEEEEEAMNRRASLMSKKKSLTPPVPVEEAPKLDAGLVEHTSLMKAAIPVLPVPLAWMCLILNVFLPGSGTIVSGFLCLCIGKSRFSTKDGAKQRVGACIIDFFIGCGQLFTVLFCLVGWGWSIWWGVIMIKLAKKYRKIRRAEKAMEEDAARAAAHAAELDKDVERGK